MMRYLRQRCIRPILIALACIAAMSSVVYMAGCPTQITSLDIREAQTQKQQMLKASGTQTMRSAEPVTSCPTGGRVRRARLDTFSHGQLPHILYLKTKGGSHDMSSILDFNLLRGESRVVIHLEQGEITDSLLSADGVWLLFIARVEQHEEVRLMRIDGKDEQTLYCATDNVSLANMQWSSDQHLVALTQSKTSQSPSGIYLLDLVQGTLTLAVRDTHDESYQPGSWLTSRQLLVTNRLTNGLADTLYLFNVERIQSDKGLRPIYEAGDSSYCWDYVAGSDGKTLYISECAGSAGVYHGPGVVKAIQVKNGANEEVWRTNRFAIRALRYAPKSERQLVALVENDAAGMDASTSLNGVWMMQIRGDDMNIAMTDSERTSTQFAPFSRDPWSNLSRDGTMYAFNVTSRDQGDTLYYGVLSGGSPVPLAYGTGEWSLSMIGWAAL